MLSVREQLEAWLKPLQLEEKQEFLNRSVVRGLDRYIAQGSESIISQMDKTGSSKPLQESLRELKKEFSQYMTLSVPQRRELVKKTQENIRQWVKDLPLPVKPNKDKNPSRLSDLIVKYVPPDKLRAFQLTRLKTADDLLKYAPEMGGSQVAIDAHLPMRSIAKSLTFILGSINGHVRNGSGSTGHD